MQPIKILAGDLTFMAELNDSATARLIAEALPITGQANRWGDEIYFAIGVEIDEAADARAEVAVGTLAYWPPGNAFCIFWGPTPASSGVEPRAASPVNIVGKVQGDVTQFASISDGTQVRLERVA